MDKWIRSLLNKKKSIQNPYSILRIEHVDTKNNLAVLSCTGIETHLKFKLNDIVFDKQIVKDLPALQAGYLGYCFSKQKENNLKYKNKRNYFQLNDSDRAKYKILSLSRNGQITYLDLTNNLIDQRSPILIFQNRNLLADFSPSEALYIGILAGKSERTKKNHLLPNSFQKRDLQLIINQNTDQP